MIENAIILAAGLGTRLKPITDNAPKCLTEVNGIPILKNMLKSLSECGIKHCWIVTGYRAEKIVEYVDNNSYDINVNYLHNEIYEKTNDMYSLWIARKELKKGCVLLEGDIFFQTSTLKRALKHSKSDNKSLYLSGKYNGIPNEVLIKTDKNLRIQSIEVLRGRSARMSKYSFMSSGILVINKEYGRNLSNWLDEAVRNGNINILFDEVISEHLEEAPIYVFEIGHNEWVEIDTMRDLLRAEKLF